MKRAVFFLLCLCLSGCDAVNFDRLRLKPSATDTAQALPDGVVRPKPRPEGLDVDIGDRPEAPSGVLGGTVVSLGSASEPGMWLKTPLVAKTRPGSVRWNGKIVAVTLIPIPGESGAGSRISLQAMQALGMPLTELAEVQVSAN